jgi:mono/diheme cytochrome c family protein
MLSRRHFWAMGFVLAGILLAGCGLQTSSEPEIVTTRMAQAATVTLTIEPPATFDLQEGANLFVTSCAPCHGETGMGDGPTASAFTCPVPALAQRGDDAVLEEWFTIVRGGKRESEGCIMPPWSNRLTNDEMWNVAAYAFALRDGDVPQPQPATTEEPIEVAQGQPTESATEASPAVTEEPVDSSTPAPTTITETFTLQGTITNGTAGASIPQNLSLTLRVAALNADGQPEEIFNAQTTSDASGNYSFTGVPLNLQSIASVQAEYGGITQFSPSLLVADVQGDSYDLPITVYETTADSAGVQLQTSEVFIDAVTSEEASLIYQSFVFVNNSDRVYVGQNNQTLRIDLPNNIVNATVETFTGSSERFQLVEEGNATYFYDSAPVFPGPNEGILATYNKSYEGRMTLEHTFAYEVGTVRVFIAQWRGLRLESDQLQPTDGRSLDDGSNYLGFQMTAPLPAGSLLSYEISDGPTPTSSTTTSTENESFLQENRSFILGIGVLLVIAGGMYMLYDLQKTRLTVKQQGSASTKPAPKSRGSREELIAQIAALDEEYEAGNLDQAEYENQREALKETLRRHFK